VQNLNKSPIKFVVGWFGVLFILLLIFFVINLIPTKISNQDNSDSLTSFVKLSEMHDKIFVSKFIAKSNDLNR
jgi:hypothetical protein